MNHSMNFKKKYMLNTTSIYNTISSNCTHAVNALGHGDRQSNNRDRQNRRDRQNLCRLNRLTNCHAPRPPASNLDRTDARTPQPQTPLPIVA